MNLGGRPEVLASSAARPVFTHRIAGAAGNAQRPRQPHHPPLGRSPHLAVRCAVEQRVHAAEVLRVFVETPLMAGAVLCADQGIGAAASFGLVMQVEAVAVDNLV